MIPFECNLSFKRYTFYCHCFWGHIYMCVYLELTNRIIWRHTVIYQFPFSCDTRHVCLCVSFSPSHFLTLTSTKSLRFRFFFHMSVPTSPGSLWPVSLQIQMYIFIWNIWFVCFFSLLLLLWPFFMFIIVIKANSFWQLAYRNRKLQYEYIASAHLYRINKIEF